MGKETAHSSQPYRRVEATSRYPTAESGSPMRGAPLRSAPVRDRRSPSWENDRRKREVKATERPIHRERVSFLFYILVDSSFITIVKIS